MVDVVRRTRGRFTQSFLPGIGAGIVTAFESDTYYSSYRIDRTL